MTQLLDGNVLIALVVADHVHHEAARRWFGDSTEFATCPITQGTLLRFLLREHVSSRDAAAVLSTLTSRDDHEFWPDDVAFEDVDLGAVVGHRQVTDAYLAALARRHGGRLATFDEGLAAAYPDVAAPIAPSR